MTEERKHAILLATVILTARRPQPHLEATDETCKPNMATEFWAKVAVSRAIERAAHILDLIDEKWPARLFRYLCQMVITSGSGAQLELRSIVSLFTLAIGPSCEAHA